MAEANPEQVLRDLLAAIEARRGASPEESYTARLLGRGLNKVAQKLGEEATETVVAALAESDERLVSESADLIYHLLVLWAARDIDADAVFAELARRRAAGREK